MVLKLCCSGGGVVVVWWWWCSVECHGGGCGVVVV